MTYTYNQNNYRPPYPENNYGCLSLLFVFLVLIMAFLCGCSHSKEMVREKTLEAVEVTSDSVSRTVSVSRIDSSSSFYKELSDTEINFVITTFDTLGRIVRTTEGVLQKYTDKALVDKQGVDEKINIKEDNVSTCSRNTDLSSTETSKIKKPPNGIKNTCNTLLAILALVILLRCIYLVVEYMKCK